MLTLLILKLLLVPLLIAAITLAGRRWGAAVAGCLAGFPVVTGPILFFIALEQGSGFAARAAVAATIAVLSNISFGIAYSWASRKYGWLLSLIAGMATYFAAVAAFNLLHLSPLQAGGVTFAGLLLATRLYPDAGTPEGSKRSSASDVPFRMAAAALLVLGVTFFSSRLGPNLTGLFAVFPVMGSVLAVFSHRHYGQRYAVKLLRGMVQGFFAFTVFCVLLALGLENHPVPACFLLALVSAIAVQTALMHRQARKMRAVAAAMS
jgi:hypothetical protein